MKRKVLIWVALIMLLVGATVLTACSGGQIPEIPNQAPTIVIINPTKTQSSIGFDIYEVDPNNIGEILKIELLHGDDEPIVANGTDVREFTGLLSNQKYTVKITYVYDFGDGTGQKTIENQIEVTTLSVNAPTISFANPTYTKSSIGFDIVEEDEKDLGHIKSIVLLCDGSDPVTAENTDVRMFENLKSGTNYVVKLTYVYDLKDGKGEQTIEKKLEIATANIEAPTVTLSDPVKTETSVGFTITEDDEDDIGSITGIELYLDTVKVAQLEDLTKREFTQLTPNKKYTVKVLYTYDLGDGKGPKTIEATLDISTSSKQVPTIAITNPEKTSSSIKFVIAVNDPENVGSITKIQLFLDDEEVASLTDLTKREFTDLLANKTYTVKATYTYDLGDGGGNVDITASLNIKTNTKSIPRVTVTNPTKTHSSVGFNVSVTDVDNICTLTKIELWKGTEFIAELADPEITEFTGLNPSTTYTVKVTYKYNLGDGSADVIAESTLDITTEDDTNVPEIVITASPDENKNINFGVTVNNPFDDGRISAIELLYNGDVIADLTDITRIQFDDLMSNKIYTIRVKYEYTDNGVEKVVTADQTFVSGTREAPKLSVAEWDKSATSVGFRVDITDNANVGQISKIQLYKDGTLVDSLSDLSDRAFTGLLSNTKYTVKVVYKYDLKDGNGSKELTSSVDIITDAMPAPTVYVSAYEATFDSISFDIFTDELDELGYITKIEITDGSSTIIADDVNVREFTGLLTGTQYTINVTYEYDLNDGGAIQTGTCSYTAYTLDRKLDPKIFLNELSVTRSSINFDIIVIDQYNYGQIEEIALYKGNALVCKLDDNSIREFTGLYSDTEYTLKVTYTYDFGDGEGEKTIEVSKKISTIKVTAPHALVTGITTTESNLSFNIDIVNNDDSLTITAIELWAAGAKVKEFNNLNNRLFTDLNKTTEYTVKVTYEYDLNDGYGKQTATAEAKGITKGAKDPVVTIDSLTSTLTSIELTGSVVDEENYGGYTEIFIYKNDMLVNSIGDPDLSSAITFDGLYSSSFYEVEIKYTYMVGEETYSISVKKGIATTKALAPFINASITEITDNKVSFSITENDFSDTGWIESINLYKLEVIDYDTVKTHVEQAETTEVREFDELVTGTTYVLEIVYSYNDNTGRGILQETERFTFVASANTSYANVQDIWPRPGAVRFMASENILGDGATLQSAKLYDKYGSFVQDIVGSLGWQIIESLNPASKYTVKLTYSNGFIVESDMYTDAYNVPDYDASQFTMVQQDNGMWIPSLIEGSLGGSENLRNIRVYYQDKYVTQFAGFYSWSTYNIELARLQSGYTYTVKFEVYFNTGITSGYQEIEIDFTTPRKTVPTFGIKINDVTKTDIMFELAETDPDCIGRYTLLEILDKDGNVITSDKSVHLRSVVGLQPGTKYTIRATYIYDLNDGSDPVVVIKTQDVETFGDKADVASKDIAYSEENIRTDWAGETVLVAATTWAGSPSYPWSTMELVVSEGKASGFGERIDKAVLDRTAFIKETYGVDVIWEWSSRYNSHDVLKNAILAGNDPDYDLAMPRNFRVQSIVANGSVYDLQGREYIDLSRDYYNQSSIETYTAKGHTFFVANNSTYQNNETAFALYFNKDLLENEQAVHDIYNKVRLGTWTWDELVKLANSAYKDDGDGQHGDTDTYGLSTTALTRFYEYFGVKQAGVDSWTEEWKITLNDPKINDIVATIIEANTSDWVRSAWGGSWSSNGQQALADGRLLFYNEVLQQSYVTEYGNIGIVPFPKLSVDQANYYAPVAAQLPILMCVPKTTSDRNMSDYFLDVLSWTGQDYVFDAYLKQKGDQFKTAEDVEMIRDYIIPNISYDAGAGVGWGSLMGGVLSAAYNGNTNNFAQAYADAEAGALATIRSWNDAWGAYEEPIVSTPGSDNVKLEAPVIYFSSSSSTSSTIRFSIKESDKNNCGSITKIELVKGNTIIEANDVSVRMFEHLTAGTKYTLRVTYQYDLDDGNGVVTTVLKVDITTKSEADSGEDTNGTFSSKDEVLTDWAGQKLLVAATAWSGSPGAPWSTMELVIKEGQTSGWGEKIDSAVLDRTAFIKDTYGVDVVWEWSSRYNTHDVLYNAILAGYDPDYDLAMPRAFRAQAIVAYGSVYDMANRPYIDFSNSYYNANSIKTYTAKGHTFFITGDFANLDKETAFVLYFNKASLPEGTTVDDLYQMVRDGEWTFDQLVTLTNSSYKDDGDGKHGDTDTYGFSTTSLNRFYEYFGVTQAGVDEATGDWKITLNDPKVDDIISAIITVNTANWARSAWGGSWGSNAEQALADGRLLFYNEVINRISHVVHIGNLGIVPFPMLNEEQGRYYAPCAGQQSTLMCVPKTTSDRNMSDYFVDVLAWTGRDYVMEAYYEDMASKVDSAVEMEMIQNYIIPNISYDAGNAVGWGSLMSGVLSDSYNGNVNNFAQAYSNAEAGALATIQLWNDAWSNCDGPATSMPSMPSQGGSGSVTNIPVPVIYISNNSSTKDSISFELKEHDPYNIGEITSIELIRGAVTISAKNANVRTFDSLAHSTKYTLRITYVYDKDDGRGPVTSVIEVDIMTADENNDPVAPPIVMPDPEPTFSSRTVVKRNWVGETVLVAATGWSGSPSAPWSTMEIVIKEGQASGFGEKIDSAVLERTAYIKETYGVDVVWEWSSRYNTHDTLKNAILAGNDPDYDLAMPRAFRAQAIVTNGSVYDLANREYLDFNNSYYNKNSVATYTAHGHTFFVTGDFANLDKETAYVLYFNKDLLDADEVSNLYNMVKKGTWTWDKLIAMANAAYTDDGDNVRTAEDIYGFTTTSYNSFYEYFGIKQAVVNQGTGKFELGLNTSKTDRVVEAIISTMKANASRSDWEIGAVDAFNNGKVLFLNDAIFSSGYSRSIKEGNIGVLPFPKLDVTQKSYNVACAGQQPTLMCVPKTTSDRSMSDYFIDVLAWTGQEFVMKAYYENKAEFFTDENDMEMLKDYIMPNINYDLGKAVGWGSLMGSVLSTSYEGFTNNFDQVYKDAEYGALVTIQSWNNAWSRYYE